MDFYFINFSLLILTISQRIGFQQYPKQIITKDIYTIMNTINNKPIFVYPYFDILYNGKLVWHKTITIFVGRS